jgi:predicted nucleotidyltransferase
VFTVEERDRVRDRLVEMGRQDPRVESAALVGSLALGGGDEWSDLDLTFGLAEGSTVSEVLDDWTSHLEKEFQVAHLFDLPSQSTTYRVFLLPNDLQVDLSFTPGREFGAITPKFELLFGTAVDRPHIPPPSPRELFGWCAHHALRARFCIERGRLWHAEYWISWLRDQALTMACVRVGVPASYGRGFDDLPEDVLGALEGAFVRSLDRTELLRALGVAIEGLLRESDQAPELAAQLTTQLRALASPSWPD